MTLHPLTSKGGAFVLKLGLVFKKKTLSNFGRIFFLYSSFFNIHHSLFTSGQDFL